MNKYFKKESMSIFFHRLLIFVFLAILIICLFNKWPEWFIFTLLTFRVYLTDYNLKFIENKYFSMFDHNSKIFEDILDLKEKILEIHKLKLRIIKIESEINHINKFLYTAQYLPNLSQEKEKNE